MNLTKKFTRTLQLNARIGIFSILFFVIISITYIQFWRENGDMSINILSHQHNGIRKSCRSFSFNAIKKVPSHSAFNGYDGDDDDELVWSNETVELFQDQLGLISNGNNGKNNKGDIFKCHRYGKEFLMSALPGAYEENFYEVMWQYFSLDALEHMTMMCDGENKLTLRAVVTIRMKIYLEQIFVNLPLETISNFPSSCYNLKYTKIIGNISPIELKEIGQQTVFLLDPDAKRCTEIAQRWAPKFRPFWRMKADVLNEVQQEFLVAKTILQIETSRDNDFNFIGVYITSEDKLPPEYYLQAMNFHRKNGETSSIFMIICDSQILTFCRDTFERGKNNAVADARIMRKSSDAFDFTMMANCNGTIVSNDKGVLHALMNGGIAVVHKPELKDDPQFYTPWAISQKMHNWHAIESNEMQ